MHLRTETSPNGWQLRSKKLTGPFLHTCRSAVFLARLRGPYETLPKRRSLGLCVNSSASAYSANYLAATFLDRYSKIKHVRDFACQIDQSIRTYFCGYTFNAVTRTPASD